MRILKVIPQAFYSARGTPLSAYQRARELVARGHEVDILTYAVGEKPPDLDVRVFRARGPHFSRSIRAGPSVLKVWFDLLLFINLLVRLFRRRYDLLYAHEEGALLARLAGAVFRIPYIYDMHSSLPLQITDWNFSARRSVISAFEWVEKLCVRGACAVVAISPAVARAAQRACRDVRCVVIVNHFELGEIDSAAAVAMVRKRHQIDPGHKLVLYTGSFVPLQALDLLIDAVPGVLAAYPKVTFLLVGGTDAEIANLRRQAQRLGIAAHVVLERGMPQKEMPMYLAAADVLVSPRRHGINPPGKLFPYLASGRPVVATNTLVHNQLLTERCAILTPPDAEGLSKGLVLALTDAPRVSELTAEAARLLGRYCSKSARDEAYAEIIAAAMAAKPSRPRATVVSCEERRALRRDASDPRR
jgi:glycosyltransferase involved in cell wall biosynthesis